MQNPSSLTTSVTSVEFCMSERNRSSLRRNEVSASSFCSITAPAIRMTKKSRKDPRKANVFALATERTEGAHRSQMAVCPAAIPRRLQSTVVRHRRDPPRAMFSRAKTTKAKPRTGPHPLRYMTAVTAAAFCAIRTWIRSGEGRCRYRRSAIRLPAAVAMNTAIQSQIGLRTTNPKCIRRMMTGSASGPMR